MLDEPVSLAEARAQAHDALRRLREAIRARRWLGDEPGEGAVIRFLGASNRWYIATRRPVDSGEPHWLVTSSVQPGFALMDWTALRLLIGPSKVQAASVWKTIE